VASRKSSLASKHYLLVTKVRVEPSTIKEWNSLPSIVFDPNVYGANTTLFKIALWLELNTHDVFVHTGYHSSH